MAKITRATQKIFGINSGFQEVAQFGSLANSSPNYTLDANLIQALGQFTDGWFAAVIGGNSPAIEDMNALCYLYAYQLAYVMQAGVPEWDAGTTYFIGSFASDGVGNLYYSLTDNNLNNVLTDSANWASFGGLTTNINAQNITVPSGKNYWYPNYIIPLGTTWTINAGGYLLSAGPTIVQGTLIVNGNSRTL